MRDNIKNYDIIIPVYRPGENFLRLLAMLKKQELPFNKLIIVNTVPDGDKDNAVMVQRLIASVFDDTEAYIYKCIPQSEFDHAGTRKMAAAISRADAFICMTDDAVPKDERLTYMLIDALNRDERIAIAYARQLPRPEAGITERYTREFNYPAKGQIKSIADIDRLGIKTFFASNVCCAYKKKIYESLGGFVDTAIFNEDMIYASRALRAGFMSCYEPGADVIHSHQYTAMQQLHRNFDLGMSQAMHPEVFGGIASEGEGIRLVKKTALYLLKHGAAVKIPGLIISSGFKYIGFKLGRAYKRLSYGTVLALAMNKGYIRNHIKRGR